MNIVAENQKEICREIKNLVTRIEENIKQEETRIELEVEETERPPAGIRRSRPNSAHNYWIGALRTSGWIRTHNY
jgi:hypothetical protein